MKKNTIIIGIIFSISLFFISCKLDVKPENTLHRPDVVVVEGPAILVRGTYTSSDIQYINVFRKDITNNENPINIGIIFPSGFDAEDKTFYFLDKTAIDGNKYVYFCRYYEGKFGYYQTEDSKEIIAPTGGSPITLNISGTKLIYSDVGKILSLDGTDPTLSPSGTDNYDFALVATNGKETQCFYLANKDWEAKDKDGTLVSTKQWNLQVLFPESFLNTEIEILGLVGQKKEINADEKVQHIFWTPLVSIDVEDANHTIHDNKLYVNIPKGTNGIDYGYFK